jgi:hypothetical protein
LGGVGAAACVLGLLRNLASTKRMAIAVTAASQSFHLFCIDSSPLISPFPLLFCMTLAIYFGLFACK